MDKGQASRRRRSSSGITRVAKRPLSPVGNRTSYTVPGDGTVTSISLINFMNHSKLDINLDPGINIITGRNGSGKSSVLQALVLGLGEINEPSSYSAALPALTLAGGDNNTASELSAFLTLMLPP